MSKTEDDLKMVAGILQLLGKEEYDAPDILRKCNHVSDGYIYEDTPTFITLRCNKCGQHYDNPKI